MARVVLGDLEFDRDVRQWQEWMIEISRAFHAGVLSGAAFPEG